MREERPSTVVLAGCRTSQVYAPATVGHAVTGGGAQALGSIQSSSGTTKATTCRQPGRGSPDPENGACTQ